MEYDELRKWIVIRTKIEDRDRHKEFLPHKMTGQGRLPED